MNTLIEAAPARTDARQTATRTTIGDSAVVRPSLAGVRIAGILALILPIAHVAIAALYVPRYPEAMDLVAWSAVAVPVGMLAIAVAMWITRAAARPLIAVQLIAVIVALGVSVAGAVTADPMINEEVNLRVMLVALSAQYLVALGVLARGAWRGILRWLPVAAASWGTVILVAAVALGELGATWWVFIIYVCSGVALTGLGLLGLPKLTRAELAR
jgi:6,7-dimethyl-8-ribityllumazine synthase